MSFLTDYWLLTTTLLRYALCAMHGFCTSWQKPLKNPPFQTSQPQVEHAPQSDSWAVRVDAAMTSLYPNNLAKDLLRLHWGIVGDGGITPQDEGELTAFSFLNIHYAVGNQAVLKAIEDNVSPLKIGWFHRFYSDHVAMANGGMHACSGGSETDC